MSLPDQRRKILIVDDSPPVAESLALVLSKAGFDVRVAHSAEDAVDLIATWEPDAAFVDIMLPGMNGIEFSDALKAMYPRCEVELMSGHPAAGELLELAKEGGREIEVLPKPFDPDRFIAIARGLKA
jgi:CheY-like chemotaxis protein